MTTRAMPGHGGRVIRLTDPPIAAVAARQRGVVTRLQLREAGMKPGAVDRALAEGKLRRLHRGVYQVGPVVQPGATELAAVLACGPGARLSHLSAATLWDWWPPRPAGEPVDVKVPGRDCGRMPGIRPHRAPASEAGEMATRQGIPLTLPLRTILDLATLVAGAPARGGAMPPLSLRDLERVVARAERARLVAHDALAAASADQGPRPGTRALREILGREGGPAFTRSEAEERFLALIRRARLPAPEVNALCLGYEVDFLWRTRRVIAEVDGFEHHGTRPAFEGDHRRDTAFTAAGFRVLRLTWRQIVDDQPATIALLAWALGGPDGG